MLNLFLILGPDEGNISISNFIYSMSAFSYYEYEVPEMWLRNNDQLLNANMLIYFLYVILKNNNHNKNNNNVCQCDLPIIF